MAWTNLIYCVDGTVKVYTQLASSETTAAKDEKEEDTEATAEATAETATTENENGMSEVDMAVDDIAAISDDSDHPINVI